MNRSGTSNHMRVCDLSQRCYEAISYAFPDQKELDTYVAAQMPAKRLPPSRSAIRPPAKAMQYD
jgi:hypothetical protein